MDELGCIDPTSVPVTNHLAPQAFMPSEQELKNGLIRMWGTIPFSQHLLTIKIKGLKQKDLLDEVGSRERPHEMVVFIPLSDSMIIFNIFLNCFTGFF